jgi:predicted membrane protein
MAYDGQNYLASFIGIFMILFVVMAILFSMFYILGIFIVLGFIFYFMFFMFKDKKMKKEELNSILAYRESRMIYSRKLSEEIP